jgi:hypothetical protein
MVEIPLSQHQLLEQHHAVVKDIGNLRSYALSSYEAVAQFLTILDEFDYHSVNFIGKEDTEAHLESVRQYGWLEAFMQFAQVMGETHRIIGMQLDEEDTNNLSPFGVLPNYYQEQPEPQLENDSYTDFDYAELENLKYMGTLDYVNQKLADLESSTVKDNPNLEWVDSYTKTVDKLRGEFERVVW